MYTNTSVLYENIPENERKQKLNFYHKIGFQTIFINFDYDQNKDYRKRLLEFQSHTDLEVHGKITLYPKNIKHLKNELRNLEGLGDFFIVVQSKNKDVLSFAVNDSRIDGISCPKIMNLQYITSGVISLIKTNQKFIEISLREVIVSKTKERSRLFHEISKFMQNMNTNMNLLLYGGWEEKIIEIVDPHGIKAIFSAIFDFPDSISKSIVNSNPQKLIEKLDNRKNPQYIQKGVKIVPTSEEED